jgi:hypothetical protein
MKKLLMSIIALTVSLVSILCVSLPVSAYSYPGVHWDTTSVYYDSEYFIPDEWQTPIANAASTWSAPTAWNLSRTVGGPNYVNSSNYGITEWYGATSTNFYNYHITSCVTNINSYYSYIFDVESVVLHEFGHWLFLDEVYGSGPVMYYKYEGQKRSLTTDDTNGIDYIY